MPTMLGTGIQLPTTTTRTTVTLLFPFSHFPNGEHVTIEEVFDAYYICRKYKRRTLSAIKFEMNFVSECYALWKELNSSTYKIGKSVAFCVTYPKMREVFAANFRDRIVHHLIINRFSSIFEQEMLDTSYACRKEKGSLYGVKTLQKQMQEIGGDGWYARCDIQGFFMSIDKDILYTEVERILRKYAVKDVDWWLWLIKLVIMHRPELNCDIHGDKRLWDKLPKNKSLFFSDGKGLPIGNLTSQVFANIYLSMFDKWLSGILGDEGRQSRYVDDFAMIHPSKDLVTKLVPLAREWLSSHLKLTMHHRKVCVQQVHKGMRFIGVYVREHDLYPSRRLIEGSYNLAKHSKSIPRYKVVGRMNSRWGLMVHYHSYMLRRRLWRVLVANDKGRFICINHKKLKERKQK